AVSGFALKFPEAWWVRLLFYGSPELRANLHRVAAVVMTLLSGWHLGWLVFSQRGREQRRALRPRFSDLRELVASVGRNLGLRVAPEPANRFGYVEKAEYWALVWGTIIMAVTGTILWAEGTALRYLPKWGLDVAEVVHYYEAWLASLAILVWHIYFTVLRPGNRSLRWAWLTGKLTEEEWREEHPGEYEQISGGS
ncbi:MAG: cytochrome b/b6 domain-containing protein, partial [Acidobacteriota bacterium]